MNRSGGHWALAPVQASATSQTPTEGRQTIGPAKPSAGQAPLPSQTSATSQAPAEGRQVVPAAALLLQSAAQQSPSRLLPSSQTSPASTRPLPQNSLRWPVTASAYPPH